MAKETKSRSNQGRNESKRGKVAGKGFVVAKTTKSDRKAIGKALGKVAAVAAPGGLGVKAATKIAGPAVKKAVAKSVEKRALKAANAPTKGTRAKEAKSFGKKYMKEKYFIKLPVSRPEPKKFGIPPNMRLKPIGDKIEQASTPLQKGRSVRLNPVGQVVRKSKDIARKDTAKRKKRFKNN